MRPAKVDDALARLLEQIASGRSIDECLSEYPQHREELEHLLILAARLSAEAAVEPSVEFRLGSPRRLKAKILAAPRQAAASAPRRRLEAGQWRRRGGFRLSWALIAVLLLMVPSTTGLSVAFAADGSSPGDPLYPLDRAIEALRMELASSSQRRSELALGFAEERLLEVQSIIDSGGAPSQLDQALEGYIDAIGRAAAELAVVASQGEQASAQALAQLIRESTAAHPRVLNAIRDQLPSTAQAGIDRANAAWLSSEQAWGAILSGIRPGGPPVIQPAIPLKGFPSEEPSPVGGLDLSISSLFEQRLSSLDERLAEIRNHFTAGQIEAGHQSVLSYENEVAALASEVTTLAQRDPRQAQALATLLNEALSAHGLMLSQILPEAPAEGKSFVEQALEASEAGRQQAAEVLGTIVPGGPPNGLPIGPP